jgi:PKD repeat protein
LAAGFEADKVEVCEGQTVSFTDHSIGDVTSWNWTFEGGNPATSTEANPTVIYEVEGDYDVELTVSDGIESNTLLSENFITVFANPATTLEPFAVACIQWTELELTGGLPEGGVYSGEFVDNGIFSPAAAGVGDHSIYYTYTNSDGCEAMAEELLTVDACIGINENADNGIKLFPNPATNVVNLTSESQMMSIHVFNYIGQIVLEMQVNGNSCQMNTSDFKSGIYSVRIETEDGFVLKQLVIE